MKYVGLRVEVSGEQLELKAASESAMALLTKPSQNEQIELLARVCEREHLVRVALPLDGGGVATANTRLVALEEDGLVMHWPGEGFALAATADRSIDVFFEHDGDRYGFTSRTVGRLVRRLRRLGETPLLKITIPQRVDRTQQRRHFRVSLAEQTVTARFAPVVGAGESAAETPMRLVNISMGGLASLAPLKAAQQFKSGDYHCVKFTLPDGGQALEFVVRCVHVRKTHTEGGGFVLGWVYADADDSALRAAQLKQVERFIIHRQRVALKRTR